MNWRVAPPWRRRTSKSSGAPVRRRAVEHRLAVHLLVDVTPMAHLEQRHPSATVVDQLGLSLLQHLERQDRRAGIEVGHATPHVGRIRRQTSGRQTAARGRRLPDQRRANPRVSGVVEPRSARFDTLAIHAGASPDPATGARSVPIHLTTSYVFDDTDHAAGLFDLARAGHIYTRMSNPTVAVLETRIAALEGGVAAVATASGQAAHPPCHRHSHGAGGSRGGLFGALRRDGQPPEPHTPPIRDQGHAGPSPRPRLPSDAAFRPETRLLMVETIGNPGLEVADLSAMAEMAHRRASRFWSTTPSPRRRCAGRSITAPT